MSMTICCGGASALNTMMLCDTTIHKYVAPRFIPPLEMGFSLFSSMTLVLALSVLSEAKRELHELH